jgi:hypothetical protein
MSSSSIPTVPSRDEPPQVKPSMTSSSSIPKDPQKPPKYDPSKYSFLIFCISSPRLINGELVPNPNPLNYDREIGVILAVYERKRRVEKLSLGVKKERITNYFNDLKPSDFASAVGHLREEHPSIDQDVDDLILRLFC